MTVAFAALVVGVLAGLWLGRPVLVRARASERRYRALTAHAPELAVMLVDHRLRIDVFDGHALKRHGWGRGELAGRTLADALGEERSAQLRPHIEAALRGKGSTHEFSEDGATVFRIDFVPFSDRGRATTHAMLAIRDVAGVRALRRSLEEQRGFLAAVLAELGDRVSVCDAHGHMLDLETGEWRHDGHPLEWVERFQLRHLDGSPLGPHEAPLLRALRGEHLRDVELMAGDVRLQCSGGPVLDAHGELVGAVIIRVDLTAHRDAEARLRDSEERMRRVVESMTDCVFETDEHGRWTHLSAPWLEATGYTVDQTLGRPAWEFVHPEDRAEHARAFAPLLRGERAGARIRHRFVTIEGAERWVEVQARATSGWDGLPTGFVGVMRDVTDEERGLQHATAERSVVGLLAGAESLEAIGPELLEAVGRDLGWDAAELWRMADDEHLRRAAVWTGSLGRDSAFLRSGAELAFEVGDGLPGQSWMAHEPIWNSGVGPAGARTEDADADGIRTTVALPLRAAGEPDAVVLLASRAPRRPEPGLSRLLGTVGAHLEQFQQRRRAEARAAARAADLTTLSEVAHELASHTDLYAARTTLCRAVREIGHAGCVVLWEPDSSGQRLEVTAASGAAVHGLTMDLGKRSMTGAAFLTAEPAFAADIATDRGVEMQWHEVTGSVSSAWLPVVHDERCVGVLAVGWNERRAALSDRDEELLRLLANEAAITIHRTDLLARLQATARTDVLTGLPNRRVWDEDLERELSRARRHGGTLCLAMLDLDRFKAYNDAYGHQAGDRLLAAAAAAWRPALRATDTLARYGGEEFAVLLPHSDIDGARHVVGRLLSAVPLGQTASAGIALWDGEESAEELLARADAALYEAKGAGRARALVA